MDWVAGNALGASKGILIFWDSQAIQILDKLEGQFSMSCRFKLFDGDLVWCFTSVYGLVVVGSKEEFWGDLSIVKGL